MFTFVFIALNSLGMMNPPSSVGQCDLKSVGLFRVLQKTEYVSQGQKLTQIGLYVKPKNLNLQNIISIVTTIRKECESTPYMIVSIYDTKDTSVKDPLRPWDPDVIASDTTRAFYTYNEESGRNELTLIDKRNGETFWTQVKFTSDGYCVKRGKPDPGEQ